MREKGSRTRRDAVDHLHRIPCIHCRVSFPATDGKTRTARRRQALLGSILGRLAPFFAITRPPAPPSTTVPGCVSPANRLTATAPAAGARRPGRHPAHRAAHTTSMPAGGTRRPAANLDGGRGGGRRPRAASLPRIDADAKRAPSLPPPLGCVNEKTIS